MNFKIRLSHILTLTSREGKFIETFRRHLFEVSSIHFSVNSPRIFSKKFKRNCINNFPRNVVNFHQDFENKAETQNLDKESSSKAQTETDNATQSKTENTEKYHSSKEKSILYEGHIPINSIQRAVLTVGSALCSLVDPARHDMIAVMGETSGLTALKYIKRTMEADSEGKTVLDEKPRINSKTVDLEALACLPSDTLGYAYTQFLKVNDVTPDSRLPVRFVDDPELAYVMQRYREVHDLIHTTLGMPTTILGEVAVKWVEGLQTGLPMCVGGALFGPIRLRPKQRIKYVKEILPWALRVGKNARPLMNIYYENRWHQNLKDLRAEFNIEDPP